jgi:cephalosporin hydroxylase
VSFDRTKLELEKTKFSIAQAADEELASQALELVIDSDKYNYAYQWTWCDLPILQLPQDVMATQEVIFRCRPTLIIETGVAWGGGIALYATSMDAYGGGRIIGIDLNLADSVASKVKEIETRSSIEFIKGSSTDESVVRYVRDLITPEDRVMVVLDSNHTHAHVLD